MDSNEMASKNMKVYAAKSTVATASPTGNLRYRISFIGDPGCGKTSMCDRFMTQKDPHFVLPTIAVSYGERLLATAGGVEFKIMAWDAAQNSVDDLNFCTRMSVILFCYDPTIRETYLHIARWNQEASDTGNNPNATKLLVAIKADLISTGKAQSWVPAAEAIEFAQSKNMQYFEVNALDIGDVNRVLESVLNGIHNAKMAECGPVEWGSEVHGQEKVATKKDKTKRTFSSNSCWRCPWLKRKSTKA